MAKPSRNQQIEESRRSTPKVGASVLYPVPLPPLTYVRVDPETGEVPPQFLPIVDPLSDPEVNPAWEVLPVTEVAAPTGSETWYPATVVGVERQRRTRDPDDYIVALETPEGISLSLRSTYLRENR